MSDVRFSDERYRAVARFSKTAWYLSLFSKTDQSSHLYKFPVEPKVRALLEFFKGKEVAGLVEVLMQIPHEELR